MPRNPINRQPCMLYNVHFVSVIRCTLLHNPLFGVLTCDYENLYGSHCFVTCVPGFTGVSGGDTECTRRGVWSDDVAFCRSMKCYINMFKNNVSSIIYYVT